MIQCHLDFSLNRDQSTLERVQFIFFKLKQISKIKPGHLLHIFNVSYY